MPMLVRNKITPTTPIAIPGKPSMVCGAPNAPKLVPKPMNPRTAPLIKSTINKIDSTITAQVLMASSFLINNN